MVIKEGRGRGTLLVNLGLKDADEHGNMDRSLMVRTREE